MNQYSTNGIRVMRCETCGLEHEACHAPHTLCVTALKAKVAQLANDLDAARRKLIQIRNMGIEPSFVEAIIHGICDAEQERDRKEWQRMTDQLRHGG